jgi:DNA (cytosine-5)-methyltransferase 1
VVSNWALNGLDVVLGQLASLGYDAWWDCIPAQAVGAPHRRDRVFIVAYTKGQRVNGAMGNNTKTQGKNRSCANKPYGRSTKKNGMANAAGIYAQGLNNGQGQGEFGRDCWWSVEPAVGRVAHGVPARVDRLRALGNAVVPQVAQVIGEIVKELAGTHTPLPPKSQPD